MVGIPAVKNILLAILSATYFGIPLVDDFVKAIFFDFFSRLSKADFSDKFFFFLFSVFFFNRIISIRSQNRQRAVKTLALETLLLDLETD